MADGKQASVAGCGHEQLLKNAAQKLQEQQILLTKACEKIASLREEKRAQTVADRMIQQGLLTVEQREEKVAELLSGNVKIAVVEQALELGLQPPAIPSIGTLESQEGSGGGFGDEEDPELNETTLKLLNPS